MPEEEDEGEFDTSTFTRENAYWRLEESCRTRPWTLAQHESPHRSKAAPLAKRKTMKFKKIVQLCLISFLTLTTMVLADSLPMENGRYSGGPAFTIKLTEKQRKILKANYKPYYKMALTKSQQAQIATQAKNKKSPTKLIILHPNDSQGDCTCGLANIGLLIKEDLVEIPVKYLATDKEAKEIEIDE
jgi:hypothetical protein